MPIDEFLVARMRNILTAHNTTWEEKKMFGGLCFMVDDKMCIGTYKNGIMARVAPEESDDLIKRKGADLMIHGGRPMEGYIFLESPAYDSDDDLEFWIKKCLEYNPLAKSSKKKKKK